MCLSPFRCKIPHTEDGVLGAAVSCVFEGRARPAEERPFFFLGFKPHVDPLVKPHVWKLPLCAFALPVTPEVLGVILCGMGGVAARGCEVWGQS